MTAQLMGVANNVDPGCRDNIECGNVTLRKVFTILDATTGPPADVEQLGTFRSVRRYPLCDQILERPKQGFEIIVECIPQQPVHRQVCDIIA